MGGQESKKGENKMKLTFALVLVLFSAASLAEECQVYRGAVEKFAAEIASRQPRPESLSAPDGVCEDGRVGLAVERLSVWLWSASPVLALAIPSVSTNVSWMPLVLAATVQTVFVG